MFGAPDTYINRWNWLAVLFALFGSIAAFGIGSSVQSNSVAAAVESSFGINPWITGIILTIFTALVILGGIQSIGIILFAYSTVLGWAYYGEKCFEYLFGNKSITLYRIVYTLSVLVGAGMNLGLVWTIADIFNALMAIPNLMGLLALSGVVAAETRDFNKIRAKEKFDKKQAGNTTNAI